jgi:hypothetical protein
VSAPSSLIEVQDLDLLLREIAAEGHATRLRKLGLPLPAGEAVQRHRARTLAGLDRRWVHHYERAVQRYGRAVVPVRGRVCQGCYVTLPTAVTPGDGQPLTLCGSCGRILYWR